MEIEELEKKYTISIIIMDELYYVLNFFGEIWFYEDTLEKIDKEMKRIYKIEERG